MGPPILPSLLGGHQGTRNLHEGTQVFVKARLPLALCVRDGAIACRVGTDGEGSGFLRLGSVSVPNSAATGGLGVNSEVQRRGRPSVDSDFVLGQGYRHWFLMTR